MAAIMNDFISIKLLLGDETRRLKLPLKELTPSSLPQKLRSFLAIPESKHVVFERFSDSAGTYVVLDPSNQAVYKQLYRAAKAKSKLRIRVVIQPESDEASESVQKPAESADTTSIKASASLPPVATSPTFTSVPAVDKPLINLLQPILDQKKIAINPPKPLPNLFTAKVEEKSKDIKEEAPVPKPFSLPEYRQKDVSKKHLPKPSTLQAKDQSFHVPLTSFTVQCNGCGQYIPGAHWHCNVCDNGDFDLCLKCVESGVHCDVDAHFLIKRTIDNGKVSYSTSTIVPKKSAKVESEKEMPGSFKAEFKEAVPEEVELTRTCNCCVNSYEESNFVTCVDCEDYDLCIPCHIGVKHGHHPGHAFAAVSSKTALGVKGEALCTPGRDLRHFATCDGCNKDIFGVRHKCLSCPDWDYCSDCVLSARHVHPGHRFAPIYEHIGAPLSCAAIHNLIRCDGPLCKNKKGYIRGDRYKCAVCHDTDFCANCEALPTNPHNRTHPMIKFRTPIRNVSVTTFGEDQNGEVMTTLGDQIPQTSSKSTETTPSRSANAATQVQTMAEIKPTKQVEPKVSKVEIKEPVIKSEKSPKLEIKRELSPAPQLEAHFVRDTIVDGSKLETNQLYHQVWVIRNPGPLTWPPGCSVNYIGGDNMLNVDSDHPASISDLDAATRSNVLPFKVEKGQEVHFTVAIKAPKRVGRAISYWRLKTPLGVPFGHKLWCDIDVVEQKPTTAEVKKEEPEPKNSESQMIFPTLEKESPASSTVVTKAPEAAPSTTTEEREFSDELESLGVDSETDDGFLTDEEYEMLDTESNVEEAVNGRK